jgi:hypothetical protein
MLRAGRWQACSFTPRRATPRGPWAAWYGWPAPGNLRGVLTTAVSNARWCSTDPVCMDAGEHGRAPDSCNLAACHGCALLPETSWEEFNRFLDRGLVIGTFTDPRLGFFSDLDL